MPETVLKDDLIRSKVATMLNEGKFSQAADLVVASYYGAAGTEPRMTLMSGVVVRAMTEGQEIIALSLATRFHADMNGVARDALRPQPSDR